MSITHQLITYSLNPDGTIPNFVYKKNDGVGGMFPVKNGNSSPQDWTAICLSEYSLSDSNPSNVYNIFESKEEFSTYMNDILKDQEILSDPQDPTSEKIPINIEEEIEKIWSIYLTVNNL